MENPRKVDEVDYAVHVLGKPMDFRSFGMFLYESSPGPATWQGLVAGIVL